MSKPSIKVGDEFVTNEGYTVEVIEYNDAFNVLVKFKDGFEKKNVQAANLRRGGVKNPLHPSVFGVGYIGIGPHKVSLGGKHTKSYRAWKGMLERCYCKKYQKKQPTYKVCSVCIEWLNFQNFAEWYEQQPNSDKLGFQLDKDLISLKNKHYSPETCSLVPSQINSLLTDRCAARGEWVQGVCYHKGRRKYVAFVNSGGTQKYLGAFSTPEEAYLVYKAAKEKFVKEQAEKYKDVLHPIVYFNLENWALEEEL